MASELEVTVPDWPAPPTVSAFCTTRNGGFSPPPYNSLNLATHVGDDPATVQRNRAALHALLPDQAQLHWMDQVHSAAVVEATSATNGAEADASWSATPGMACAVMTADCLPVLFTNKAGTRVAAAHAGWRGLAEGVLEATIQSFDCPAEELMAWLGPCIGPAAFEVGEIVREAFVEPSNAATSSCFVPQKNIPGKYLADLPQLARIRLRRAGVAGVYGEPRCTVSEPDAFFSYRRDGVTGRMATLICLKSA